MSRLRRSPLSSFALSLLITAACAPRPDTTAPRPLHPTVPATEVGGDEALAERLSRLAERLEVARVEHHVPGMALAVVKDDRVVFAKGFGKAHLADDRAADVDTVFAIGSSTKAFTATVVGQLVDAGKMSWDDPLVKYVPEFVLDVKSDDSAATATVRDALCHRTGFTRMGVLWASGEVPRNDFLAQAAKAEPLAKFREEFLYNNVTYTAAGEASARAEGVLWAELVTRNLLEPLGMRNSVVLAKEAQTLGMAQGYKWDEDDKAFEAVPMRPLDEIAPAGAINSTALDMTAWLRFQLGNGTFRGERLIEAKTLEETRTPQIEISGNTKYGLGWFVDDYEGQTMLHHGGNIDGYSAMVSFLPKEKLGVVMLSNVSFSGMQEAVKGIVYDTLLEEEAANGDPAKEDLSAFEGKYVAGFGGLAGKLLTVTSKDGKLFVDVPGQQNFELKPPGEDGKRSFALTNAIAVSFEAKKGKVNSMHLYQGGFDFELFREGYEPEPEVPLEKLEPLLGEYEHSALGRAKVLVRNNRLAIDVPKQMVYDLFPPDDEGMWKFRVKDDIAIAFSPKDAPAKVVLHQGGKTFDLVRVKAKKKGKGPSAATVAKVRRDKRAEKAFGKLGVVKMTGNIRFVQAGVEGTLTLWVAPDGRMQSKLDLGKFGWSEAVNHSDRGWEVSSFSPREDFVGKRLQQAQLLSPLMYGRSLQAVFDDLSVEGTSDKDGREVITIRMTKGELPSVTALVDAKTGDIVHAEYEALWSGPGSIKTEEELTDYRKVFGLRLPHRMDRTTRSSGTVRITGVEYSVVSETEGLFPAEPPAR